MSAPDVRAHLGQVLGAAAVTAGLGLARVAVPQALTDGQAREAARAWGLLADGGDAPEQSAQAGGGGACGQGQPGVVVVLVDGLGALQLDERRGHARCLRSWEPVAGGVATTCCPSTTAAAITTLGTGTLPGWTGMLGYSVRRPELSRPRTASACAALSGADNLSLISWEGAHTGPRAWQDVPTLFERLVLAPGASRVTRGQTAPMVVSVGPARFAGSGLTEAALRGARHLAADRMEDRPARAAAALRRGTPLVYLYVGELDHVGHHDGWRSGQWLAQLERLDGVLDELVRRVPAGTRLLLTADHGMVDTDAAHTVVLTDSPELMADVAGVAGEPRLTHLYVWGASDAERAERAQEVAARWRRVLGARAAWVATAEEMGAGVGAAHPVASAPGAQAGSPGGTGRPVAPFGPLSARGRSVLGDVVVAMADRWVVVDPRVHSPSAMTMPGVHGSVSDAEVLVPLLTTVA